MRALSIVIPTRGSSEALPEVLAALARQLPPLDDIGVEILLALDAHADRELGVIGSAPVPLHVVHAVKPGASAARNAGWRSARSPLVLFLDDDIVAGRRLVAEHLEWHRRHPEPDVAVLGDVRWADSIEVTPFMRWLEMGIQFDYRTIDDVELDWTRFYSCNVSVKREALERVGGFDEDRFPFGYEDLELARRLSERGLRVLYNRAAAAEHLKAETPESWRTNLRRIAIAERRFTAMYPGERAYFHELFQDAADQPAARGRSARLARLVPPQLPLVGPFVWRSYDLVCRQRLAPEFLAEWEAAG